LLFHPFAMLPPGRFALDSFTTWEGKQSKYQKSQRVKKPSSMNESARKQTSQGEGGISQGANQPGSKMGKKPRSQISSKMSKKIHILPSKPNQWFTNFTNAAKKNKTKNQLERKSTTTMIRQHGIISSVQLTASLWPSFVSAAQLMTKSNCTSVSNNVDTDSVPSNPTTNVYFAVKTISQIINTEPVPIWSWWLSLCLKN